MIIKILQAPKVAWRLGMSVFDQSFATSEN
jgi:hypothetical protein